MINNNNNGIDNNFAGSLVENVEAIGKLFEAVNVETMEPAAQELLTRLMMFVNQTKMMANAREIQVTELNDNLLRNDKSVATAAYFLSSFIESKELAAEFMEYAVSKQTTVSLLDVDKMAYDRFADVGCNGISCQELKEAEEKASTLYKIIKNSLTPELQKILLTLDDAMGDVILLSSQESFAQGFKDAMSALKSVEANG